MAKFSKRQSTWLRNAVGLMLVFTTIVALVYTFNALNTMLEHQKKMESLILDSQRSEKQLIDLFAQVNSKVMELTLDLGSHHSDFVSQSSRQDQALTAIKEKQETLHRHGINSTAQLKSHFESVNQNERGQYGKLVGLLSGVCVATTADCPFLKCINLKGGLDTS